MNDESMRSEQCESIKEKKKQEDAERKGGFYEKKYSEPLIVSTSKSPFFGNGGSIAVMSTNLVDKRAPDNSRHIVDARRVRPVRVMHRR